MNAKEMIDLQIGTLQPRISAVISQIIKGISRQVTTGDASSYKTFDIVVGTELEILLPFVLLELELLGYKARTRLTGCDEEGRRTGCELVVRWWQTQPVVHG